MARNEPAFARRNRSSSPLEISFAASAIRRFYLLVLATSAVLGALVFGLRASVPTIYQARSSLEMQPSARLNDNPQSTYDRYIDNQISIYEGLDFLTIVAKDIGNVDAKSLRNSVSLEHQPGTDVVSVVAQAKSPKDAQLMAATYTASIIDDVTLRASGRMVTQLKILAGQIEKLNKRIEELQSRRLRLISSVTTPVSSQQLAEVNSQIPSLESQRDLLEARRSEYNLENNLVVRTRVIDAARVEPIPRRLATYSILGGIFGAGLGSVAAIILAAGPRRVLTREELVTLAGAAPAANMKNSRRLRKPFWRTFEDLPIDATTEIDRLCVRLESLSTHGSHVPTVVVAGAQRNSGTTTLASAIATRFAQRGGYTLLVDADLVNPALTAAWSKGKTGLSDVLSGRTSPNPVSSPTSISTLRVLGQGNIAVSRRAFPRVDAPDALSSLAQLAEVIVIDGGSLTDVASSVRLAQSADVLLLAVPTDLQPVPVISNIWRMVAGHSSVVMVVATTPFAGGFLRRRLGFGLLKHKPIEVELPEVEATDFSPERRATAKVTA